MGGNDNEPVPGTGDPSQPTQEGEVAVANQTATVMVMEECTNVATWADRRLDSVSDDHPRQNDGRHLDRGVADDTFWHGAWGTGGCSRHTDGGRDQRFQRARSQCKALDKVGCRCSVYIQLLPALNHAHSALPRKILLYTPFP